MDGGAAAPITTFITHCIIKLIGVLFFRLGKCRECKHSTSDLSHDLCRSHAFCAKGSQYFGALCSTCEDLWDRARDFTDPQDSIAAFDALAGWIKGFRKNSKGRPPGQVHFYDPRERVRFQELHAMIANLRSKYDEEVSLYEIFWNLV